MASTDMSKRMPQSVRNLRVVTEVQPNALGLLFAWAQAKEELDTRVPCTISNNPWHPTGSSTSRGKSRLEVEPLSELAKQIAAAHATGLTQQQVADQFHLQVQTVRRHLRLAGTTPCARRSTLSADQLAEAKSLVDSGVSLRRLGTLLGMSHNTVSRLLEDYERRTSPTDAGDEVDFGGLSISWGRTI